MPGAEPGQHSSKYPETDMGQLTSSSPHGRFELRGADRLHHPLVVHDARVIDRIHQTPDREGNPGHPERPPRPGLSDREALVAERIGPPSDREERLESRCRRSRLELATAPTESEPASSTAESIHPMYRPPLTPMVCPVANPASPDARKSTHAANSSGV